MGLITSFLESAKAVVTLGASVNRSNRQNVISIVNDLHGELTRGLFLTDSYLRGVKNAENFSTLSTYLRDAETKLMHTFLEHHVCAGIYGLRDRLSGVFDPAQHSIDMNTKDQVIKLIHELSNGERMIIDDVQDMILAFREFADELDAASSDMDKVRIRDDINNAVDINMAKVGEAMKAVKKAARQIIDKL